MFALSSPTAAAAFSFRARHNGKSHKNHIHQNIDARQDVPNAPVAGPGVISSPGAIVQPSAAASTASLPFDEQFETVSAMDGAAFGGQAAGMTSMSAAGTSSSQATITSFASPVFPSTVIQIPIYTICPDTPGYLNASSTSMNNTALYSNATGPANATSYITPAISAIPVPFNATALLSNGSYTTFLSQSLSTPASLAASSTSPTTTPAPDARIVLGDNGCQTLYSASTTQLCSTTITRGGQVPITVSDCSQLVTFSSSSADAAGATCNCPNIPATPTSATAAPTSPASQTSSAVVVSGSITSAAASASSAGMGLGIAFYAAPWHEIAAGVVPGLVQVANCPDDSGDGCATSSESWSVSTSTSTTTSTRTVQYAGVSYPLRVCHLLCQANMVHSPQYLRTTPESSRRASAIAVSIRQRIRFSSRRSCEQRLRKSLLPRVQWKRRSRYR